MYLTRMRWVPVKSENRTKEYVSILTNMYGFNLYFKLQFYDGEKWNDVQVEKDEQPCSCLENAVSVCLTCGHDFYCQECPHEMGKVSINPSDPLSSIREEQWLIWSNEHNSWWRSNRFGYTKNISEAGRYQLWEAKAICDAAGHKSGIPNEVIVPSNELVSAILTSSITQREKHGTTPKKTNKTE